MRLHGTRRQALRAAFAGVVGLTLPAVLRTVPAAAAGPADCRKGCAYMSGVHYQSALSSCRVGDITAGVLLLFVNPFVGLASAQANSLCFDVATLKAKADGFDCFQPNCPGFDPRASGGPCDGCTDYCCTCQASGTGYICCVFPCDDANHNCCPS
jgi:hypothetical protein